MADNSAEIQAIEEMLNSGVTSTRVGTTQVTIDISALRRRLAELRADDDTSLQASKVRPTLAKFNLHNF